MEGLRNEAWLALGVALSTALSCLPESDDLGAYAAEWSPAAGAAPSASAGSGGSAGVSGFASASAPDAGAGSDGVGEGVGGALPLAGVGDVAAAASGGVAPGASDASAEPTGPCADGVLGPDQTRCYRVSEADAAWQSARDQCFAWQGALVRVDTAEEDQFIGTLASVSQWLGASDIVFDNVFVWTDGSPVMFGNWGPGQPDRFPGPDCVEKREGAGRLWFDQPCDNPRAFVCEKAVTD